MTRGGSSTHTPAAETRPSTATADGWRYALGAYMLWGLAPLYWNELTIGSAPLTAWRVVGSLPTLWLLAAAFLSRHPRELRRITDNRTRLIHLGTAALLGVNWLVFVFAIGTDRVVDASLGYFINPLVSVVLGFVVLGERLSRPATIAVLVACVGVIVLWAESGTFPWIALVLALSFGIYGLVTKLSPLGAIDGLTLEVTWLMPFAAAYLAVLAGRGDLEFGTGASPWLLLLIGVVTAVPLLLFGEGAKRIPLWMVGLLQYVAPTLQFLVGVVVFGEAVTTHRLVGFIIIWIALAIFASWTVSAARSADGVESHV